MRRIGTLLTRIVIGRSALRVRALDGVTALNGIRIELAELTPDSLQRQAIDNWK